MEEVNLTSTIVNELNLEGAICTEFNDIVSGDFTTSVNLTSTTNNQLNLISIIDLEVV